MIRIFLVTVNFSVVVRSLSGPIFSAAHERHVARAAIVMPCFAFILKLPLLLHFLGFAMMFAAGKGTVC